MLKVSLNNQKGQSLILMITAIAAGFMSFLLIFTLYTSFLSEIECMYDNATMDCFLSNKAAIVQMKIASTKPGFSGEFDIDKCKDFYRENLANNFNLQHSQDDTLLADVDNNYVKYAQIMSYSIDNNSNELTCITYIATRPYFFSSFFEDPVYKIKTVIDLDNIES